MYALMWTGPRQMEMQEILRPHPAPGEVLIRVSAVGICGSELSGYLGHNSLRKPPLIMGHEFSGTVEEDGGEVEYLRPGDRVTVNPLITCGACPMCRGGRQNLCLHRTLVGVHRPGAFAQWVAVPARNCHVLPPHMSDLQGSLVEPLACGLRAASIGGVGLRDQVLVLGAGPMGLVCLAAARRAEAAVVAVSDPNPVRLEVARAWGATHLINPREQDPLAVARELTDGMGFPVVIDAVGMQRTRQQAIQAAQPGGRVVFLGLHQDETALPCNHVVRSEVEVVGSFSYSHSDFTEAIRQVAEGLITPDPTWLEERPLAAGDAAFAELIDRPSAIAKIVLRP